jgi:hypothetical protein
MSVNNLNPWTNDRVLKLGELAVELLTSGKICGPKPLVAIEANPSGDYDNSGLDVVQIKVDTEDHEPAYILIDGLEPKINNRFIFDKVMEALEDRLLCLEEFFDHFPIIVDRCKALDSNKSPFSWNTEDFPEQDTEQCNHVLGYIWGLIEQASHTLWFCGVCDSPSAANGILERSVAIGIMHIAGNVNPSVVWQDLDPIYEQIIIPEYAEQPTEISQEQNDQEEQMCRCVGELLHMGVDKETILRQVERQFQSHEENSVE